MALCVELFQYICMYIPNQRMQINDPCAYVNIYLKLSSTGIPSVSKSNTFYFSREIDTKNMIINMSQNQINVELKRITQLMLYF